jgi:hypothetical protein
MFSSYGYIDGHRPIVYAYIGPADIGLADIGPADIGLADIGYIYIGMCGAIGIWLDRVNR